MRSTIALALACCVLAGCSQSDGKSPGGQVVATVNGEEITAAELNLELGGAATGGTLPPQARKAVIDALISRKLLVAEAERRQLDKTSEGQLARERARDLAMVDLLRRDLAPPPGKPPSGADLDRYVAAHADTFSQRQLVTADQLTVQGGTAELAGQLRNVSSLDEGARLLAAKAIPSSRSAVVLDTLFLDHRTASAVMTVPLDGLVVAPSGTGATIRLLQVRERQPAALLGGEARSAARVLLARQTAEDARARLEKIVQDGQKYVAPPRPDATD